MGKKTTLFAAWSILLTGMLLLILLPEQADFRSEHRSRSAASNPEFGQVDWTCFEFHAPYGEVKP